MAAALLALAACGPVRYVAQVGGPAATALERAESEGAAEHAPFEYTAARAYYEKAREEASRSQYQTAIAYGKRAEALADKARALTRERKAASRRGPRAPEPSSGEADPGAPASEGIAPDEGEALGVDGARPREGRRR